MKIGNLVFQWIRLPKQPERKGFIYGNTVKNKLGCDDTYISDNKYDLISLDDMKQIINLHRFSEMTYISEKRDCDDFSFSLMGLIRKLLPGVCFGIVWVEIDQYKHAVNFFVDDERDVYFVEPQSNQIFRKPHNWKPYFVLI